MYEVDNWADVCIEIMRSVHGYEKEDHNQELKCTDYTKYEEGEKLFRVPRKKGNTLKIDLSLVNETQKQIENELFSEAVLLANEVTAASKRIIDNHDKMSIITNDDAYFSHFDLLKAVYAEVSKQCQIKCGKTPESKEDCPAEVDKNHKCTIWMTSNDADFHSKMGWTHLLFSDFNNLMKNREKLKEIFTKKN
jgi:hypothetical protein